MKREIRFNCRNGGSGWVLLTYSHRGKKLINQWAEDHSRCLVGASLILALDMYEHAYALHYGANAREYIDAFFQNINWEEVNRRAESVRRS